MKMKDHFSCLSKREMEVLYWVSLGKTNWEIGVILDISLYTVKNHIKNILVKLNATNRTHATQRARSLGIPLLRPVDLPGQHHRGVG